MGAACDLGKAISLQEVPGAASCRWLLMELPVFGSIVMRRARWIAVLTALVLGVSASAQAPGPGEAHGGAKAARKIEEKDRIGWRATMGPRLRRRLADSVPSEGLRVSVVLARDDLPRHRGKSRREAVARRQGRVFDALPGRRSGLRRRLCRIVSYLLA